MEATANMARAAWPSTLVVVLTAFLVTATVLMLLVRGLSRLGRSARTSPAPNSARPSSNGFGMDRDRSRPLEGNDSDEASPRRRTTYRRPPP
jgi:hypothetical protein